MKTGEKSYMKTKTKIWIITVCCIVTLGLIGHRIHRLHQDLLQNIEIVGHCNGCDDGCIVIE